MLAKSGKLPTRGAWAYEVKWDGPRRIVSTKGASPRPQPDRRPCGLVPRLRQRRRPRVAPVQPETATATRLAAKRRGIRRRLPGRGSKRRRPAWGRGESARRPTDSVPRLSCEFQMPVANLQASRSRRSSQRAPNSSPAPERSWMNCVRYLCNRPQKLPLVARFLRCGGLDLVQQSVEPACCTFGLGALGTGAKG